GQRRVVDVALAEIHARCAGAPGATGWGVLARAPGLGVLAGAPGMSGRGTRPGHRDHRVPAPDCLACDGAAGVPGSAEDGDRRHVPLQSLRLLAISMITGL